MSQTANNHLLIETDANGVAFVSGTNTKVVEIVLDAQVFGRNAREISLQHPHLSYAQVCAVLQYYADHQQEVDADIERRYQYAETLRQQATHQFTRQELEQRLKVNRPMYR